MPNGSPSSNGKRCRGRPPKIVKYHKAKRQHFATLPVNGRAEYFYGDTEPEVLEKYNRRLAELQNVTRGMSDDEAESELLAAGVPEEVIDGNSELLRIAKRGVFVVNSKWLDEHPDSPLARLRENKLREKKGLPPLPLTPGEPVDDRPAMSKRRLSDCLSCWREWKQAEGCEKTYIDDVSRAFRRFRSVVGNRRIAELTADDFAKWRLWVARESQSRASVKWARDQHKHVKTVLDLAESEHPNWGFPDGLAKWLRAARHRQCRQKYVPKKQNREPMPAEVVRRLLEVEATEAWANAGPERFGRMSQRDRARRLQAQRKRREGVQIAAILRLAVNCALDNLDCVRITPEAAKLDAPLPHMDFPRQKVERQVGYAVPRLTPLLPSTVAALRRWLEFEPPGGAPTLFRNARRNRYRSSDLNRALKRLRQEAGVDGPWTFKHLRNIGPLLRKAAKLPKEMSDALLGHVADGTSAFYEDDVGPEHLAPLVDLIGGEHGTGGGGVPGPRRGHDLRRQTPKSSPRARFHQAAGGSRYGLPRNQDPLASAVCLSHSVRENGGASIQSGFGGVVAGRVRLQQGFVPSRSAQPQHLRHRACGPSEGNLPARRDERGGLPARTDLIATRLFLLFFAKQR